ncbi:MAG: transporter ATP-binding protein [Bradyrhizobium sp.]|nr:transporter ATP-binding protein [Bradyrhizobium sp.]
MRAVQGAELSVPILEVSGLTRRFGGLVAVNDVSFSVNAGEIVALIGPNGAGKTTTFSMISGFQRPNAGTVIFDSINTTNLPPHRIAELGLARSFQIMEIFAEMTVLDSITTGALLRLPMKRAIEFAGEVAARVGLSGREYVSPTNLSLQDRKLLELAKCLATQPKLILLDEVMSGLTLAEAETPVGIIRELRASGITFVLVEHVMPIVMSLADRSVVLNFGEKAAEGTPDEIIANQAVKDAYFGEELHA